MSDWKILPKQEHHRVFELLEEEIKVQTRWSPEREWFDVTLGTYGYLWMKDPVTVEYKSLFIGKERDFRYLDERLLWVYLQHWNTEILDYYFSKGHQVQVFTKDLVGSFSEKWLDIYVDSKGYLRFSDFDETEEDATDSGAVLTLHKDTTFRVSTKPLQVCSE